MHHFKTTVRLFSLLLLFVLIACGQHSVDSKARQLNDSAVAVAMKSFDSLAYVQAISLLDQAIAIDSNYRTAYWNKLSYQSQLKQYDKALQTAKHVNRLFPDAPESYFQLGLLYHKLGDSVSSTKSFEDALVHYDRILDTMRAKNNQYIFTLVNKATNLIVLGREDEGNDMFKKLNDTLTNSLHRQTIEMLMNRSRKEILEGIDQTESKMPNLTVDASGKISWTTENEEENTMFEIEDRRWNTWISIGQLNGKGTGNHSYSFIADTSCGLYQIRLSAKGNSFQYSTTANYPNPKDVITKGCGGQFFNFNTKTKYEVLDQYGNKLLFGCDNKVDISSLQSGVFFINYGNKTAEFVHK